MIAIIRKQFAAKKYENEYKMAGLMTLTKPFDQYSGEEIKRLLCSDNETYFQINKKATLRAARIIPSTLYAIGAEKNLVEHTTLSKEDAAIFPFALTFSTPTEYVGSSLDFLLSFVKEKMVLKKKMLMSRQKSSQYLKTWSKF